MPPPHKIRRERKRFLILNFLKKPDFTRLTRSLEIRREIEKMVFPKTMDVETLRKMKFTSESAQNVEMTGMPEWIAEQQRELLRVQKNIAEISETMPLLQAQETYQKYWKATKSYEHMVKTSELIYNDSVENYNCMLYRIPDRIAAGICGYHRKKLIEIM